MQRSDSNQFVPQGRPAGSRNKRTKELLAKLEARGDLDPADFLSALITDEKEPKELRVQASNVLLPYIHPKWQSTPVPRYLEDDINIPKEFTCVEDAEKFLAHITARVTAKTLDLDFAEALSKMAIGSNSIPIRETGPRLEVRSPRRHKPRYSHHHRRWPSAITSRTKRWPTADADARADERP